MRQGPPDTAGEQGFIPHEVSLSKLKDGMYLSCLGFKNSGMNLSPYNSTLLASVLYSPPMHLQLPQGFFFAR